MPEMWTMRARVWKLLGWSSCLAGALLALAGLWARRISAMRMGNSSLPLQKEAVWLTVGVRVTPRELAKVIICMADRDGDLRIIRALNIFC
jgi:hypothetical protein